ncbi:dipeptidase [Bosea sp. (in: a-proteobacteria)]|uniref:dipeptidase n=1 Tax=Bosea sp. (in: a-proteobacteria) TaxID=1871050 RepID=UPI0026183692|nr:dipeptidase [Bosea sp. (in: a-proteobacteria)]MCO5093157.1 dipeptidase [Bosea sp. (in: a-proteobacteria)]
MHDLHRESIVIVGHSDIIASDVDWRRESGERKVLERRHMPTLRKGGVTVICDHIGGDAPYGYLPATQYRTTHLQRFMRTLDHTYGDLSDSEHFTLVLGVDDIARAKREGKIGVVICLEGGAPLEGEISYLRNFHRLGLRCFGLTHDMRNELGDGIRERNAGGLTNFGVNVVKECNRLGIVVDVSHLSDKGTEDVLATSSDPITASHSNARALCSHPRNLPDHFIRDIAKAGGVIGFHALDGLVSDEPGPTIEHVLRHIAYVAEKGGVDCIAIGPDLMENWDPPVFTAVYERSSIVGSLPVQRYVWTYPAGMRSNADLPNVTEGLLKMGFSEDDVRKFLGGNLMRLFGRVWKPAA